jgi:uncharacterized protein (DUF1501 family)
MQQKSYVLSGLFAGALALSLNVFAAADTDKAEKAEKPEAASAPMTMHSHMQEKTGAPQKMEVAKDKKTSAIPPASKHYHPRDGK